MPSFVRGARAFSLCSFKKDTRRTKNLPLLCQKNIIKNGPIAGIPPSVRLKEHQTKPASVILTERLQNKKSVGRIFGAATPPGALVPFRGISMVWCLSVWCLFVCAVVNGSLDLAARATVLQAFLYDYAAIGAA